MMSNGDCPYRGVIIYEKSLCISLHVRVQLDIKFIVPDLHLQQHADCINYVLYNNE